MSVLYMNCHQTLKIESASSWMYLLLSANYIIPYLSPCLVLTESVSCSNIIQKCY
jgi:hypothetical protein